MWLSQYEAHIQLTPARSPLISFNLNRPMGLASTRKHLNNCLIFGDQTLSSNSCGAPPAHALDFIRLRCRHFLCTATATARAASAVWCCTAE